MSLTKQQTFLVTFIAAFALSFIPIVNLPFSWTQTYFHEISHGLAAMLTGGSIDRIELNLNGSGVCYTYGGSSFLVTLSGYLGASVIGAVLYLSVSNSSSQLAKYIAVFLGGSALVAGVLWGRELITWLILIVIAGLCLLPVLNQCQPKAISALMHLLGCYVLLDALKSPLYLLDGRSIGDGATLASMTHLPEIVWVGIWELAGCMCLFLIWKRIGKEAA
ncbi:M50 family metallopeptidase [Pseudomonadota bacterium]